MSRAAQKGLPPIKVGSVSIPRYRLADGRVMIAFPTKDKKRKCQTFTDPKEAAAEAERIARDLNNGGTEAQIFTSADRADFSQAKKDVAPHGVPVHVATASWSQVMRQIGGRHSLQDVVQAGLEVLTRKPHPVPEVVEQMFASTALKDIHAGYNDSMKATLRRFAAAFPGDIREVKAAEIQAYLDGEMKDGVRYGGIRMRKGEPIGTRRRDNILKEIRQLFRYARMHSKLPDVITEPQKVPLIDEGPSHISFFTVAETRLMLEHVLPEWQPYLALLLFNGFRADELVKGKKSTKRKDPLRWDDLDWNESEIIVRDVTSKVGSGRAVPFHEITKEYLLPHRKDSGFIAPQTRADREFGTGSRLERVINRTLKNAPRLREEQAVQLNMPGLTDEAPAALLTEFSYRKNAMRHSYGSYRMAILKSIDALAEEMGTSPAMIRKHYRNPRPLTEARGYFGLRRSKIANVIPFPDAMAAGEAAAI